MLIAKVLPCKFESIHHSETSLIIVRGYYIRTMRALCSHDIFMQGKYHLQRNKKENKSAERNECMNSLTRLNTYYSKATRFALARNVAHVIEGDFGHCKAANTVTLPFDVEDMKLLITAYDGYVVLVEELERIFDVRLTEGCFEDLSALKTLIQRVSPLYEEGVDWDAQAVGRILADSKMPLEDAAKRLMGC